MKRYETELEDGVFYIEQPEGRLEVGSMAEITELLGERYTLEYDERQRQMSWLDTDENGELTFDVRETLTDLSYDEEFLSQIAPVELEETDEDGYPLRTSVFADLMGEIWDSKGNL